MLGFAPPRLPTPTVIPGDPTLLRGNGGQEPNLEKSSSYQDIISRGDTQQIMRSGFRITFFESD